MTQPISPVIIERILAHESEYWSTIAHIEQRNGWKAFCNLQFVPRIDPNHAGDFRSAEGEGERIAQEILDYYRPQGITPAAYVDSLAPADLIPALTQAGFQSWSGAYSDLMFYLDPDRLSPPTIQVKTIQDEATRRQWASILEEGTPEASGMLLQELYFTEICDQRVTAYLVQVDGEPACRCELFSANGLGRVEAVRTRVRYRQRGLASAAVRQAIRDSQLLGNDITYLYAEPGGDAQRLYQQLGFRTVAEQFIQSFLWTG